MPSPTAPSRCWTAIYTRQSRSSPARPTRDVDLLGRISNDLDSVRAVIAEIVQTPVADDGLVFDAASVTTERIAEAVSSVTSPSHRVG